MTSNEIEPLILALVDSCFGVNCMDSATHVDQQAHDLIRMMTNSFAAAEAENAKLKDLLRQLLSENQKYATETDLFLENEIEEILNDDTE